MRLVFLKMALAKENNKAQRHEEHPGLPHENTRVFLLGTSGCSQTYDDLLFIKQSV
jgi:hypothetical protein